MKQKQRIWSKFICDDLFVACLILCCVATYFREKIRLSWPRWRVFLMNLRWNLSTKFGRVPAIVHWWISIEHDGGVFVFWFIYIWLIRPGTKCRCHTCTYLINFNVNFMSTEQKEPNLSTNKKPCAFKIPKANVASFSFELKSPSACRMHGRTRERNKIK